MTEHVDDLIPLYVADALPPDERATVEAHLRSCAHCRAERASFDGVTVALAGAVATRPPDDLRDRVLAAAHGMPQQAPRSADAERGALGGAVPSVPRRPWRWGAVAVAAAAVALIAAVGLGVAVIRLQDRVVELQARSDQLIDVIARATDVRSAALEGGAGTGTVLIDAAGERAVLVVRDLADPAADRTYQSWVIVDGAPRPAPTFRPGRDGSVTLVIDAVPERAEAIAVTEEPAGGSTQPSTTPILLAQLSS